jgi:hypothetical protein
MEKKLAVVQGDMSMAMQAEQFLVNEQGKRTAVVVPIKRYQRLLEDLHDLAVVAERKDEEPISLPEMKKRLKKDGLL